MNLRLRQTGSVVISAILMVALCVTIAFTILSQVSYLLKLSQLSINNNQAYEYALGVEDWAIENISRQVSNYIKQPESDKKSIVVVPQDLPVTPLDNHIGFVSGRYVDLSAKLNINNLVNNKWHSSFIKLLENDQLELDTEQINALISSLNSYLKVNANQKSLNQTKLQRYIVSLSELRLIPDYSKSIIESLNKHVTALPEATQLNINTVPAELISMLHPEIDFTKLDEFRQENGRFKTVDEFMQSEIVNGADINKELFTTQSNYFLVESVVELQRQKFVLFSLLKVTIVNNAILVNVIWHSINTM